MSEAVIPWVEHITKEENLPEIIEFTNSAGDLIGCNDQKVHDMFGVDGSGLDLYD